MCGHWPLSDRSARKERAKRLHWSTDGTVADQVWLAGCPHRSEPRTRAHHRPVKVSRTYFMVPVTEMGPVAGFYERVFGLNAAYRSDEWTEFSLADDVAIALHRGLPTRQ